MFLTQTKECQWQTDQVIKVSLRHQSRLLQFENPGQHLLGRRFSGCSGDTNHRPGKALTNSGGEIT